MVYRLQLNGKEALNATMASFCELLGVLLTSFVLNLIPFAGPSNLLIAADAALLVNVDPWVIGFLVAFGSASAKLMHYVVTFFVGSLVREERRKLLNKVSQKVGRWAFVALYVAAATPIPDEPIVIPLGLLKYNPIKFYLAYFLGKLSITILGAYMGKTAKNLFASTISQQILVAVSIILTIAITIILLKVDVNKILQTIKRKWQTRNKPLTRASLIKENQNLLICLASLSAFLLILLFRSAFSQIDTQINIWMPSIQSSNFTHVALVISDLFDIYSLLIITVVAAAFLFFKNRKDESLLLLGAMVGVALITEAVKVVVRSPRPLNGLIVDSSFSFPSGHTTGTTVFCGLLAFIAWQNWKSNKSRRLIAALAVAATSVVGFDRIYLNVHWFSDILGSYMLGIFWTSLSIMIFNHLRERKHFNQKSRAAKV